MYKISGVVKKHLGRGRELGYPTANLDCYCADIPDGIYVGHTNLGKQKALPSLIFVGAPKTFNETERKVEVHILNFDGDLYEKILEVEILKKIRDNQKFSSIENLVKQMKKDEKKAREYYVHRNY